LQFRYPFVATLPEKLLDLSVVPLGRTQQVAQPLGPRRRLRPTQDVAPNSLNNNPCRLCRNSMIAATVRTNRLSNRSSSPAYDINFSGGCQLWHAGPADDRRYRD
jgi:hypothetical protein